MKKKGRCIGHCHRLVENRKDAEGGERVGGSRNDISVMLYGGGVATEKVGQARYPY